MELPEGYTRRQLKLAEFVQLPFLDRAKDECRWTLTNVNPDIRSWDGKSLYKMPIDICQLCRTREIVGCYGIKGQEPHMTLTEIAGMEDFRDWKNACYCMNQNTGTDFVVLDVEPSCPDNVKAKMLSLPWLYAETSLSGNGLHLVFRSPGTYREVLTSKSAVKPKGQYAKAYEIIMGNNHHITFTMNQITRDGNIPVAKEEKWTKIWERLASKTTLTKHVEFDASDLPPLDDIPDSGDLLFWLNETPIQTPEYYGNDISTYEFAAAGRIKSALQRLINTPYYVLKKHTYTKQEQLTIMYAAIQDRLQYRPKHDETREGMPWLLHLCYKVLTMEEGQPPEK